MAIIGGNLIVYLSTDTSQFERGMSKATGLLDDLKSAAKIAAGVLMRDLARSLTQGAVAALKMGAQIETLRRSFESLSAATGEYVPSLAELRRATKGMVSDTELLLRANEALALGIPTEDLDELFDAAIRLGKAMGIDATRGIQSLTLGVGRQSRLVLDNLGIIVRAEEAYAIFARRIGKTSETLTENERRIAFQTVALEKINEKAAILGDNISKTDMAMDQWTATIKNVTTGLGEMLGPLGALAPLLQILSPAISILAVQMLPRLIRTFVAMIPPIIAVEAALTPLLIPLAGLTAAIGVLALAWATNFGGIQEATAAAIDFLEERFTGLSKAIEGILKQLDDFFKITEKAKAYGGPAQAIRFGQPAAAEAVFDPFAPVTTPTTSRRGIYRGITIKRLTLEEIKEVMTPPEFQDYLIRKGLVDETAQHGLFGIVSRPTTILAGEAGPELVSITPLHKITMGRTAGQETAPRGEEGYSPTFVFNIKSLTGDRAGARRLGDLTAEEHFLELRRRGKTI